MNYYQIWRADTGDWIADTVEGESPADALERRAQTPRYRYNYPVDRVFIVAKRDGGQRQAGLFRLERVPPTPQPEIQAVPVTL